MQRGHLFLFVVISAVQLVRTGESPVSRHVHGFVGGSVHMRCELELPYNVNRLYFQRTASSGIEIFINGFDSKELPVRAEYKNRTMVNKSELSMEMLNLSIADEGEYTCIPFHNGVKHDNQTKYHLKVTANYSVPNITVQGCGSGPAAQNCVIVCSASGGFPRSNVTWRAAGNEMSSLLRSEGDPVFVKDTQSQLWNVSHTVTLNCSRMLNITCTVGGVLSPAVNVCLPPDPPDFTVVIACAVLTLISFAVVVIVCIMYRRAQPSVERSTDAELASLK